VNIVFKSLETGCVGVKGDLTERLDVARKYGFEGVGVSIAEVKDSGPEHYADELARRGLVAASWGLTVDVRTDEDAAFRSDLADLPAAAELAARVGLARTSTWIPSFSDTLPAARYAERLVGRVRDVAQILADQGQRLGLEFLGPETLRAGHTHECVHTLDGMLEIVADTKAPNVGLLLDSWHWHTSGGTVEELAALTNDLVVTVHVNDAPEGVPTNEYVDNDRRLPTETGVIDLAGFMSALAGIGYDGPLAPEPFDKSLADLTADERMTRVEESMRRLWQLLP
jgi:sugar phosphate isomerase/epimerase